ncbi:Cysteine protease atg4 [Malassezia psittaci]|uniref:Cysteine protease n=1 Tax=Malassezia psittaci TaxID=1821823 RepID=A0AAF0FI61_9BASI|nr:Cysteine protease atg4 [Malassezia psittaci]
MSTEERTSTESASGTSVRVDDRGKRSKRIARIRQGLPRRMSMSKSERPVPVMNNTRGMSQHSETLSEDTASMTSSKSQPYEIHRSELDSHTPAGPSPEDPMIPRRIVQWITRVANSSEQLSPDTPNSTKPKSSVIPEPFSEPSQPHRGVRRRGHHRITRPIPANTSGNRLGQLSERLTLMRDRSRLWQMASDTTLKLHGTDPGVWLLGTYFGDPEPESSPAMDPSEASTESVHGSTSETTSEAVDNVRSHNAWRRLLYDHLRTLVWCTYRSHFPPIAQDGYIGADEEATSAAVSAATEELCIPKPTSTKSPSADGHEQDPNSDPPQSLMQFLARSREVLQNTGTTRDWLINQLESRGWQLPGLLAQLPITSALLSRNELSSPTMIAAKIQAILGAVEHDVLMALRRPLAANVPMARLRSLAANWGGDTGLPGLWSYVRAIYQSVSSITQPNGPSCDTGWGCMLRTAQSLLATSLIRVHLGRDWTLPKTVDGQIQWRSDEEHAKYARILSLFYDDPSSACPFSVHRLAAEGKRLGIEVGSWFGPSTVAKALERLAKPTHLGITLFVTNDGTLYQDELLEAAHNWDCPVLVLVAQRIGLEEVPKPYRCALKSTFAMPQSVGVAGGRPSSSVYFVGTQRDQLLYLDPHTTRPSVPFRHVPPSLTGIEVLEKHQSDSEKHQLLTSWYCHAYSTHELASYRPAQTQLMPLSVVDPSILMGFVLHSENDWLEFRQAAEQLPAPVIHIAEHRPDYAKHPPENRGSAEISVEEGKWDSQTEHCTGEPSETNTQETLENGKSSIDLDAKLAQSLKQDLDLDPEWVL